MTTKFFVDTQTRPTAAMSDMTSLALSGRFHEVIEYCIEVHRTGPFCIESNNSDSVGLDVRSALMTYIMSVAIFKLSDAVFRLAPAAPPIGGLLA